MVNIFFKAIFLVQIWFSALKADFINYVFNIRKNIASEEQNNNGVILNIRDRNFVKKELICKKILDESQNPVMVNRRIDIYLYLFHYQQIINQTTKKRKPTTMNNLETLLTMHHQSKFDFEADEKQFDIRKLELQKLSSQEIRVKWLQLKQRQDSQANLDSYKSWMQNEYKIFIWFMISSHKFSGIDPQTFNIDQWKEIGTIFHKDYRICQYFYYCCKKNLASDPWAHEQDQIIIKLMNQPTTSKKWTEIGMRLFEDPSCQKIRKPKTIRQRWLSKLNPDIKKDGWNTDEDLKLLNLILYYGKKWSQISKIFGNRNQHTIKNRYHQLIKQKGSKLISQEINMKEDEILEEVLKNLQKKKQRQGIQEQQEQIKAININKKHQTASEVSQSYLSLEKTQLCLEKTQHCLEKIEKKIQKPKATKIFAPIIIQKCGFGI